jgi:uncharacterized protein (DUF305 family)
MKHAIVLIMLAAVTAGSWIVVATATGGSSAAAPLEEQGHNTHVSSASVTATHESASPGAPTAGEIMFVTMMIDHHQQAIEMSDILAEAGDVPPRVANLAESIRVAQSSEIGTSRSWLDAWAAASAGEEHGSHDDGAASMTMSGMIGPEGFTALRAATGTESARVYLGLMIEHHDGAIEAARSIYPSLTNPWVISFVRHIVREQTVEVEGFQHILDSL